MMTNVTLVREKAECTKPESMIKAINNVGSIIECGRECLQIGSKSISYGRGD